MILLLAACAIGTLANDGTDTTSDACTEIGCIDGFVISLVNSDWDDGRYEFLIDVDGAVVTCEYTIPLGTSDQGGCDSSGVLIGTGSDHSFYEIFLTTTTATAITVTIQIDGTLLTEASFTPDYQQVYPNGEECPPVCTYDGEALVVD